MTEFRGPTQNNTQPTGEPTARTEPPRTFTFTPTASTERPVPPPPPRQAPPESRASLGRVLKRLAKGVAYASLVAIVALTATIIAYRWINPPITTLIASHRWSGQKVSQTWVPLSRISPNLMRAVIMSEDAGFCRHPGVAWREIVDAYERSKDGIARGGSTISMQVTKNLFLWPSKSYLRKALEIPITLGAELVWPKARTLEIYLNIVEWGPGIFGAEAAARYHFDKPASRLTEDEAALLAVALPAPVARDAGDPSALQQKLAQTVLARMRSATIHTKCLG